MVLHNGYHRACALRAMGFTHAPCVVQTVTRRAELDVAATRKVSEDAAFYFKAARPPLLKDFFDPRVSKTLPVRRMRKVVEVSYEIKVFDVAD
jgi:esterase/lipase superfamily enzyme